LELVRQLRGTEEDTLIKALPIVVEKVFGVCHEEIVSSWAV